MVLSPCLTLLFLQAQVLEEVRKIMTEETGKPVVDAIYFTSFVMQ